MKTGSEFHVGIVGLGSMGMGAALSCVRAGLSTWGADLNSNACATLKEYREVNHLILLKNPGGKWIKRDLMG